VRGQPERGVEDRRPRLLALLQSDAARDAIGEVVF
jgi:hypothetical protein